LIHPSSIVDPKAQLGEGVEVGPFSIIEGGAVIGARTKIHSHVVIKGNTTLGEDNTVRDGSILGGDPQDRKYAGEPTFLIIGNHNFISEYVTMHRATGEGRSTRVGDNCYIMAYCHLGHNATLQNGVTMANSVGLAGHTTIEDFATIGGMAGIHQFARVGKLAMVGGFTKITRDVPPFMICSGPEEEVLDINAVGLRRIDVTPDRRMALHRACKLLYKSQLGLTNALETVRREVPLTEEVQYLLAYEERRFRGKNGRGDQR
jgi:UDP-N-acetylglucosamine acyltransferase